MINRTDRIKPTQPFFVLASSGFMQEIYMRQGISHFYSFTIENAVELVSVPDGCIDLLFEYSDHEMKAYACGTVLACSLQHWDSGRTIFGVRFLPGNMPAGLSAVHKDLINKRLLLDDLLPNRTLIEKMAAEKDFYQRIRVFLEEYTRFENRMEKPYGKLELCLAVKDMIYESNGNIKVSALSERTGYSERYINKVFMDMMGFSPKLFCKIIQFQRAVDTLNYGNVSNMTETAVNLGYYDQSQFIKDFKQFAGITPKKYLKLIDERDYHGKIKNC